MYGVVDQKDSVKKKNEKSSEMTPIRLPKILTAVRYRITIAVFIDRMFRIIATVL